MTVVTWIVVALAGGVGAAARYGADAWLRSRTHASAPWSTVIINVGGSLALGVLVGAVADSAHADRWWVTALSAGLLGGFTTFSTISVETAAFVREGRHVRAAALAGGLLVTAVGAALLGFWLGGTL